MIVIMIGQRRSAALLSEPPCTPFSDLLTSSQVKRPAKTSALCQTVVTVVVVSGLQTCGSLY